MKTLITALTLAGSFVYGYGQTIDSLTKYNQKNKQVYEDFVSFIKEYNPETRVYINPHKEIAGLLTEDYISVIIAENCFIDHGFNGMEGLDKLKKNNKDKIKEKMIKDMTQKKQLLIAKEYTNLLKEMMHTEAYKEY